MVFKRIRRGLGWLTRAEKFIERDVWTEVTSSNILRIRYRRRPDLADTQLRIQFGGRVRTGGGGYLEQPMYFYVGVPETIALALYNAPSKGKFFHRVIKKTFPTMGPFPFAV